MFKRLITATAVLMATYIASHAVPAYPYPQTVTQPDGTIITYVLHGDEFGAVATTLDGLLLQTDADGAFRYAAAPEMLAHNAEQRTQQEISLLQAAPQSTVGAELRRRRAASTLKPMNTADNPRRVVSYSNFRAPVILVEFTDRKFLMPNPAEFFGDMINKEGYDGFEEAGGYKHNYTGSVRDYFADCSGGQFTPVFDVIGPIKIDRLSTDANQTQNIYSVVSSVYEAADEVVDCSIYDSDGDGKMDMSFIIFAGYGSNYTNGKEMWPHASTRDDDIRDGVRVGRYACATELWGTPDRFGIEGIGTICHEFSHVLGLMDEYDTDGAYSGGYSEFPGKWSLMGGGNYNNAGRTPPCYSAFQQDIAGFAKPEVLTEAGTYTLESLGESHRSYRINTVIGGEYFIIENRQRFSKWDQALPGDGLLIYHVDRTDLNVWYNNQVNVDPDNLYYQLLRATPISPLLDEYGNIYDSDGDPFPGSGNVTYINNYSTPSLKSRYGYTTNYALYNIAIDENGVASFTLDAGTSDMKAERFSNLILGNDGRYQGEFTQWSLEKNAELVETADIEGVDGMAVAMYKNSNLTTGALPCPIGIVKFDIANASNYAVFMRLRYSLDDGASWHDINTIADAETYRVAAGEYGTATFNLADITAEVPTIRLRINENGGPNSGVKPENRAYVDNVEVQFNTTDAAPALSADADALTATVHPDGTVDVRTACTTAPIEVYTICGQCIHRIAPSNEAISFQILDHGVYILRQNTDSLKIIY
ncbi:MAG: M6 family metalloprotease domain-containing protein [Muribaculaceae bacterium]